VEPPPFPQIRLEENHQSNHQQSQTQNRPRIQILYDDRRTD
jgi:hypothetical protein